VIWCAREAAGTGVRPGGGGGLPTGFVGGYPVLVADGGGM